MGDIGEEILAHLINLRLFLDILFQLVIGTFQFGDCCLKRIRQAVKMLPKFINFILMLPPRRELRLKIKFRHPLGNICQLQNRRGNSPGNKHCRDGSEDNSEKSYIDQELI